MLLIVALVAVLGYGGWEFYQYRESKSTTGTLAKDNPKQKKQAQKPQESGTSQGAESTAPKEQETQKGSLSVDSPSVTLCGVTVEAIPEMLKNGSQTVTVSRLENSVDENGNRCENYELDMNSHKRFEMPVEVSFPCKVSPNIDVVVKHYDAEMKEWMPLVSFVDETRQTVSAYFGSFSPVQVSYLPIGVNPKIYWVDTPDEEMPFVKEIKVSPNYWRILQRINPALYSDEVNKFVDDPNNYAIDVPKLDPKMNQKAAYEAFVESSTLWTFCDPLINLGIESLPEASQSRVVNFMIDNSSNLGNAMNAIPFVIMAAQLAYDLHNLAEENSEEAFNTTAMNLYKGLIGSSGTIYSLVSGFSHLGFSLAFFGVALFGMELDYFIDAAKAEQAANVEAVFNAYYRDVQPFDALHWYKVFENAYWKNQGKADKAMVEVKEAVDDYCTKFWRDVYNENNDDILFATTSAGYKKVFFNATEAQKRALAEQQKIKVWKLIETKSMKYIQRFMTERLQSNTLVQLTKVVRDYNKELIFEIMETFGDEEEDVKAKYCGHTICLGIDGQPFKDWHVNIPDSDEYYAGWTVDFHCSVYGYMLMGMPNQVLIYKNEEDFKSGKKPVETKNFNPNMRGGATEIQLHNSFKVKDAVFFGVTLPIPDFGEYTEYETEFNSFKEEVTTIRIDGMSYELYKKYCELLEGLSGWEVIKDENCARFPSDYNSLSKVRFTGSYSTLPRICVQYYSDKGCKVSGKPHFCMFVFRTF